MSKQNRFSTLAIAAGLLLTASATCFAQTESNSSQTESANVSVVAMNKTVKSEARVGETNSITITDSATTNADRPALSTARFMESTKGFVVNTRLSYEPQIRMESTTESSAPVKTKRITFVPSRGPRLPQ